MCRRCWPMAAHILQVAYYPILQETRTLMLKSVGYQVTSALGNDNAIGLDAAVIAPADLIVVGFSASHSVRSAMVLWFKNAPPQNFDRRLAVQQLGESSLRRTCLRSLKTPRSGWQRSPVF